MGHLVLVDLRRHAARTVLTEVGIAIGVATIVALLALSAGIERAAAGLIRLGGAELGMFQAGVGELTASSLPQSLASRVRDQPGVADATPIAVAVADGKLPEAPSFLVFGVEPGQLRLPQPLVVTGRPPARGDEAMVGEAASRNLGLGVGDSLSLRAGRFRITGIYHAGVAFEDQGAALALRAVERMRKRSGDATTIAVKVERGMRASELADRLGRRVPRDGPDQPAGGRTSVRPRAAAVIGAGHRRPHPDYRP